MGALVVKNTLVSQRSINRSWLSPSASATIPSGVITDIQVTTLSSSPVLLDTLVVKDETLTIVLSQDGGVVAHGVLGISQDPQPLLVSAPCLSATVMVGALPEEGVNYTGDSQSCINSCCVFVTSGNTPQCGQLNISQDGTTTTYELSEDYTLDIDTDNFTVQEGTGVLTISMEDVALNTFQQLRADAVIYQDKLRSINNISTPSGILEVSFGYEGKPLNITLAPGLSNHVILDGTDIPPCDIVDKIDQYISPKRVRDYSYAPLDDAYDAEGTRNTKLLERKIYNDVTLYTVDPTYDQEVQES